MKVLLSVFACDPTRGGEFQTGWQWAIGNARRGHRTWCLTTPANRERIEGAMDKWPPCLSFEYVAGPGWLERYHLHPLAGYLHYFAWQQAAWRAAQRLDRAIDFDIVHHATYGSLQLGTALWRLDKPLVFGPAGGGQSAPRQLRRYFGGSWRTELARGAAGTVLAALSPDFRRAMQRASVVFAVNRDTRHLALRRGAQDVRLMPDTGLSDDFFPKEPPRHRTGTPLRLLWLGRVIPRKGLALALDALGTIGQRAPFRLTVIGDGVSAPHIPEWISRNALESRVDWRGAVPWQEIRDALATHDVLFFPTLRDSCPSQFFEAMSFGLPVICLDIHGARDFVPDEVGVRVAPRETASATAAALGDAVVELARSPERYHRMGDAAARLARWHRWPCRIERMSRVYSEICAGSNS